jgi:hypothetical protein
MMTVTVVFLDGTEQQFLNADYRVSDGVLTVWEDSYSGRRNVHHFPLASIRTWRVER